MFFRSLQRYFHVQTDRYTKSELDYMISTFRIDGLNHSSYNGNDANFLMNYITSYH
jgi:hypothetical protein